MKPPKQRLSQNAAQGFELHETQSHGLAGRQDFASPEELLRADRRRVQVPEHLAERLGRAIEGLPPVPSTPWWKRLLS